MDWNELPPRGQRKKDSDRRFGLILMVGVGFGLFQIFAGDLTTGIIALVAVAFYGVGMGFEW